MDDSQESVINAINLQLNLVQHKILITLLTHYCLIPKKNKIYPFLHSFRGRNYEQFFIQGHINIMYVIIYNV